MKLLPLSGGKFSKINDDMFDQLIKFSWTSYKHGNNYYAQTTINKHTVQLHRMIICPPSNFVIDHIDGDGLNNQRENLRAVSHRVNLQNQQKHRNGKPVGITVTKNRKKKFRAKIKVSKQEISLGTYENIEDAIYVYNLASWLFRRM